MMGRKPFHEKRADLVNYPNAPKRALQDKKPWKWKRAVDRNKHHSPSVPELKRNPR
jgi:hypothetical protein